MNECSLCPNGDAPGFPDLFTPYGDTCGELAEYLTYTSTEQCDTERIEIIQRTGWLCNCPDAQPVSLLKAELPFSLLSVLHSKHLIFHVCHVLRSDRVVAFVQMDPETLPLLIEWFLSSILGEYILLCIMVS